MNPVHELDGVEKNFVLELIDGFQYGSANKASKGLLSGREMEVLKMVEAGAANKEIAEKLIVAVSTVKTHLLNIYEKLDVNSRTRAVMRARELNIL